jgi:hypothetical protein
MRPILPASRWALLVCAGAVVSLPAAILLDLLLLLSSHDPVPHVPGPVRLAGIGNKSIGAGLPIGADAPDFPLPAGQVASPPHLASFRGLRPVVLLFGSPTCDIFCRDAPNFERLFQKYGDAAAFYFVYVGEAHAYLVHDPDARIPPSRPDLASKLVSMPMLLDVDGSIERAYNVWPTRVVVVDTDGRIALQTGAPGGDPARPGSVGLEEWLRQWRQQQSSSG